MSNTDAPTINPPSAWDRKPHWVRDGGASVQSSNQGEIAPELLGAVELVKSFEQRIATLEADRDAHLAARDHFRDAWNEQSAQLDSLRTRLAQLADHVDALTAHVVSPATHDAPPAATEAPAAQVEQKHE